ncbi:hypothetical protein BLA50215_03324 [Burkholderia lata]|nr:hypothetical protein BLA50215_03324 [Burkholderia lata]
MVTHEHFDWLCSEGGMIFGFALLHDQAELSGGHPTAESLTTPAPQRIQSKFHFSQYYLEVF